GTPSQAVRSHVGGARTGGSSAHGEPESHNSSGGAWQSSAGGRGRRRSHRAGDYELSNECVEVLGEGSASHSPGGGQGYASTDLGAGSRSRIAHQRTGTHLAAFLSVSGRSRPHG